jgi:septal ring factor EnvC (AmiA/AmiB activator)
MGAVAACAVMQMTLWGSPLAAQPPSAAERLRQERDSLTRIKDERTELQKRLRELQTTAHDLSEERSLLDRQANATARVVRTLDQQLASLAGEEQSATANLVRAQDELAIKRSILRHRVREIYKRGPLYSVEALLSAQSFGNLVARYKYLHLVAQRDRALVGRVESLGGQIANERQRLVKLRDDVEFSRKEKTDEEKRLRNLEDQRGRSLVQAQQRERQTETRLGQLARDEARLGSVIANLDSERKRLEGRAGTVAASTSSLKTSDLGRLDWPVEGTILYSFGRVVNPNNTTTAWQGVGIAAPLGTPVKAVSAGTVVFDSQNGTFGLTIVLHHGGGDYSVYSSLDRILVTKNSRVAKGQVIGTVGQADPDLGAHLHFEVRPNQRAVDPLEWLRSRR